MAKKYLCPYCGYGTVKQIDDELICDHCQSVVQEDELDV